MFSRPQLEALEVQQGDQEEVRTYGRCKKKVPIYRPYNGTGNSVPFPFRSRLISVRLPFLSVFKPFPFCPKSSLSVLVNGTYGVIKHAQSLIAVISTARLATVQ